jgi:hypothetical protein
VEQSRRQAPQQPTKAAEARKRSDLERQAREKTELQTHAAAYADAPPPIEAASAITSATGSAMPDAFSDLRNLAAGVPLGGAGTQDWRRAVAMMEVLGPPISMRGPGGNQRVF